MGNCLDSSAAKVDSTQSSYTPASGASRISSRTSRSSVPSSLTIPSYSGKSSSECFPTPRSEGEILSSPNLKAFSFNELKSATRNFRPDSLLGEGGFGCVFKGWIDENTLTASKPGSGMVVAVKKLKPEGFQGHKEWLHLNTLQQVGICDETVDVSDYFVIYANPFLVIVISDDQADASPFLDQASSIMAKLFSHVQHLHCSLRTDIVHACYRIFLVHGAPKSCVYCNKASIAGQNLADWAKPYLGDKRKLFRIMDTKLGGQYPQKGAFMAANLALQCLSNEAKARPRMSQVLATLENIESPKVAAKNSRSEHQTVQTPVRQSPMRHHHAPGTPPASASPLPSHLQSPRLRSAADNHL
ncbi:hypothetical protein D5086_016738 [Populus alba]|uniref:Uncharacterized protein n=1 Tax=Populus alba TaxID=43335 RepID=A0ACC4BW08_POPAL